MANSFFSFTSFDFNGIQGRFSSLAEDKDKEEEMLKRKQDQMFIMEEFEEVNPLFPEFDYQDESIAKNELNLLKDNQQLLEQQQHQAKSIDLSSGNFQPNFVQENEILKLKSVDTGSEQLYKPAKEATHLSALSSLELLSNYASGFKRLKGKLSCNDTIEISEGSRKKLSTEEIMRVAGARYIQFSDQSYDDFSMVMHPFGYALSGLSEEETRDVELAHLLLAAAEKVGNQQYERATRLLSRCEWIAVERGNPVQRIVFYFAVALRERIDKETGNITSRELQLAGKGITTADHGLGTNSVFLSFYQLIPFNQVLYFAAIQTILENVSNASKVHLVDFEIRSGVHWTPFMQALAERGQRPIQLLKITAFGIRNREDMEETGKRLSSFAESFNLPFQFKIVCLSSFSEIKEGLFQVEKDESVVIYCSLILRILISRPSYLENLMSVIRKLNPSIMVVIEVEANHNSPSFVNRFIEALFYYSAFFDSLETCIDNFDQKIMMEAVFNNGIKNIVASEGGERTVRSVKMEVWRAFFSRFRMLEMGFSDSCVYQANLFVKQFPCASCCSLDNNGKSLVIGWKGTPMLSLSAWKFSREKGRSFLHYRF
ncbi:DELLA protein RGL1-like [Mangifera indica]|uniref:DELLA protein RGL1-like n=1 Tax=Mangifera indica TaxID=29780 RepID=UPI001CF9BF59|nr:DELLA protein RGL1-like [Mangifera indica]